MRAPARLRLVQQRSSPAEVLGFGAWSEAQFVAYANQVPVIFAYRFADNEENQARGIVGMSSGFRQGVRSLAYVPASQHPATASAEPLGATIRYYDLGRQRWRSYRKTNLVSISAFWSEELQQFVDTPELAGIVAGLPFQSSPRNGAAQINEARQARSDARAARRREREQQRQQQRQNEQARREARRRQNQLTRASR